MKNDLVMCVWLTGLPCSGKTTIGRALSSTLKNKYNINAVYLDGDEMRKTINSDLGFSKDDREENIRRIIELVKLLNKNGIFVIAGFISPYKLMRKKARDEIGEGYIEVFVDAPVNVCEFRDVKGMYKESREKTIKNFTGISSQYEIPENPDMCIRTDLLSVENSVGKIVNYIKDK